MKKIDVNELKLNFEKDEFSLLVEIMNSLPKDKILLHKEANELMAIEYPLWDPNGPPQLLGKYWVQILQKLYIKKIDAIIQNKMDVLKIAICDEFEFCKKKAEGGFKKEFDLVIAIADSILPFATQIPIPITLIAVYIVRNQIAPRVRNC